MRQRFSFPILSCSFCPSPKLLNFSRCLSHIMALQVIYEWLNSLSAIFPFSFFFFSLLCSILVLVVAVAVNSQRTNTKMRLKFSDKRRKFVHFGAAVRWWSFKGNKEEEEEEKKERKRRLSKGGGKGSIQFTRASNVYFSH